MTTLTIEQQCTIQEVCFLENSISVLLDDGRTITVPLAWYPRLYHATLAERNHYELIGDGEGIHWPDLDEDISAEGIIAGRRSKESQNSLKKWLEKRQP